jgi:hypothetical protein
MLPYFVTTKELCATKAAIKAQTCYSTAKSLHTATQGWSHDVPCYTQVQTQMGPRPSNHNTKGLQGCPCCITIPSTVDNTGGIHPRASSRSLHFFSLAHLTDVMWWGWLCASSSPSGVGVPSHDGASIFCGFFHPLRVSSHGDPASVAHTTRNVVLRGFLLGMWSFSYLIYHLYHP